MTRLFIVIPILIGLFFTLFPSQLHAIEASGEGITRAQALNNALKNAIEMSMGVEIEQTTLVENFQVIRQQMTSHAKGYIKSYKLLSENQNNAGLYTIRLEAEVDNKTLHNSQSALLSLMQMASHPRVLIAPIQHDFDAISPLRADFTPLLLQIKNLFRDEFKFIVPDDVDLRSIKRPAALRHARQHDIDYIIFVELIQSARSLYTVRLHGVHGPTQRDMGQQSLALDMQHWTQDTRTDPHALLIEAGDHIHPAASQLAQNFVDHLQNTVLDTGQEFLLRFSGFEPKTLKFLPDDLAILSGYVRHDVTVSDKKRLGLSYWSALDAHTLQGEVKALLKRLDAPHQTQLSAQTITFIYDDPLFD